MGGHDRKDPPQGRAHPRPHARPAARTGAAGRAASGDPLTFRPAAMPGSAPNRPRPEVAPPDAYASEYIRHDAFPAYRSSRFPGASTGSGRFTGDVARGSSRQSRWRRPRRVPAPGRPLSGPGRPGLSHPSVARPPRRPTARWTVPSVAIVAIVAVLTLVGLVMVLSASSVESLRANQSSWSVFRRQVIWVAVASVGFVVSLRVPYWRWKQLTGPFFAVCLALLILVTVTPLGVTRNGSTRWIGPPGLQVQPSEFTKLALILVLAKLLDGRSHRIGNSRLTLRPAMIYTLVVLALVFKQPDMGTAMITLFVAASLLLVANIPMLQLLRVGGIAAVCVAILGWIEPYRRDRVLAFLHPDRDLDGIGYHLRQSLVGLGSGGLFGVGVGASRAKWGFLPNAHSDFIFAIIGEELGLVGGMLIVSLFVALTVLGVQVAQRSSDRFGTLLAAGITVLIVSQALVNIGAVIGIMPITGVPLPYVSAGGSSMLVIMVATGLLVNIARHGVDAKVSRSNGRSRHVPRRVDPETEHATHRHPAAAGLGARRRDATASATATANADAANAMDTMVGAGAGREHPRR